VRNEFSGFAGPRQGAGTAPMLNAQFGGQCRVMGTLLWIIAVILVVSGVYAILARRQLLWGVVLIVVGLLVGPGGVSIFHP
jgi:hypothetical protein